MVYLLLTGEHYLDFALGEEEMLRQIADASPRAFADRGVAPWPGVEAALHRALEKDPKARFPDVAALAEALERAAGEPAAGAGISAPIVTRGVGDRLASRVLQRLGWDGALMNGSWPGPPTASINYGAAGAAYFLYRASCLRGDPALLALADVWSERAAQAIGLDEGFYNPAIEITSETVGRISPYHSPSGVHAVQALIARARGDDVALGEALHHFIDSIQSPCANPDLTLGQCGVLLATTLLVEALPESSPVDLSGLLAMGRSRAEQISGLIDAPDAVRDMAGMPLLGIAHGWAGLLYGTLRWCETTRRSPPDGLVERLDELANLAEPVGRGMRWPWQLGLAEFNYMPGWCNGSAGYVYLWTLAHRLLDRKDYAALAQKAAWNAWEDPSPAANLCCGWAGRGFAMLHWYKHTGESLWLQRAQVAARRAAELIGPSMAQSADGFENSLYKGELGVAALAIEVDYPDQAAMPFFESERMEH
jgi:serine/threonine-protein kinase